MRKDAIKKHCLTHTNLNLFKCTQCDKSFKVKMDLSKHFRIHSGEKPLKCKYCEQNFRNF